MSNPTTPFSWQMPTATDLVTDLPADFEVFGQAVATSMADLLGGTTGQVLSKTTNADMDFTWINNDQGDITGVTAGTGISGGGTSGTVTVTNSMATAIDAKGDLVGGTGADTFARLAVGSNGTILTADSAEATGMKWAAAASAGLTFIGSGTFSAAASATLDNCFTSTYRNYLLTFDYTSSGFADLKINFRTSGVDNTNSDYYSQLFINAAAVTVAERQSGQTAARVGTAGSNGGLITGTIFAPQATAVTRIQFAGQKDSGTTVESSTYSAGFTATTSFDGIKITAVTANLTGTFRVYGLANS